MTPIGFLSSDVGRGHPFYLDGLVQAFRERRGNSDPAVRSTSVFDLARGPSAWMWHAVRSSYRVAGQGGPVSTLYHRLRGRSDYDRDSLALRLLGASLRPWAAHHRWVVVDHPVLVGALAPHPCVFYMHGELIAPTEAIVRRAAGTFVPLDDTARAFVEGGVDAAHVVVTGCCVERDLQRLGEAAMQQRRLRLQAGGSLTLAFFSSGAEPPPHVDALVTAARSAAQAGHRALVFAARGGRLQRTLARTNPGGHSELVLVGFEGREQLDRRTAEHFASFDAVVSPPHERSQWAYALGVPFFLVGPDIGPFAPLNRRLLRERGVALELRDRDEAMALGPRLAPLRVNGTLRDMLERGWGPPRDGFDRAAAHLDELVRSGVGPG